MTPEQMQTQNLEPAKEYTSEMFLMQIPCYKVKGQNIWVAQYDFRSGEDLRPKDLYSIYGYKRVGDQKKHFQTRFTKELLESAKVDFVSPEIKSNL